MSYGLTTRLLEDGETVSGWSCRLHPGAEHVLDWFHITMRFTVLQQIAKSIAIPDTDGRELAEERGSSREDMHDRERSPSTRVSSLELHRANCGLR
jgi:hypothetical protein